MIGFRTLRTFAAAAALAAASAFAGSAAYAQAHHGGGGAHVSGHFSAPRGNFRFDRGRGRDVVIERGRFFGPRVGIDLAFGYPYYGYYGPGPYPYYYDGYYAGGGCHTDYRWDYWSGRPAEIALQVCYDDYGRPYTVPGSQRWVRWR